jgi:diguanylate cyclase (GGDEF)-like protein/PAS domain S-box-containing protein
MIVEHRDFFDDPMFQAFLETFENSIDSVVITSTSPEEYFLYVNEAFKRKTGYTENDLIGKSPRILQGPQTNRVIIDDLKSKLQKGQNFIGQNTNYRKDGTTYIVKWYISALKNDKGKTIAYVSYQKEITQAVWDHKQAQFLASVVNQVDQMVVVTDLRGDIVYVNDSFLKQTGYDKEFVMHRSINFIRSGKHTQSFYADIWQTILQDKSYHGTLINKRKNGELYFEQKTITPIKNEDGDVEFFVSIGQDITELVQESNEYKNKAYHDTLTGLYNRLKFDEIVERKYRTFLGNPEPFSIILMDIDDFKYVNDTYGHDNGDKVLKEVTLALQSALRKDDLLVRWGGEEFVVLIDSDEDVALQLAEKLKDAVAKQVQIDSHLITLSFGVSQMKVSDTIETLFSRVDKAMYESKKNGKNRVTSL